MQIYHVETQEDYDAFRKYIKEKGLEYMGSETFSLEFDDSSNTRYFGIFKHAASCDLDWLEEHFPNTPIQKYKANQNDHVNKPSHYTQGERETIENIRDTISSEGYQGYCIGNVVKYLARYKFKNGLEDVKKAKKYIEFLEEELMKQED